MRNLISFLFIVTFLLSSHVYAGAGHSHGHGDSHGPASQVDAEKTAINVVSNLAKKQVIDASWESVAVSSSEKRSYGGQMEWVVVFKNDKVEDTDKQTLYVFLTIEGKYLAANYTGN